VVVIEVATEVAVPEVMVVATAATMTEVDAETINSFL
jgi:hypothetical protein